VHASGVQYTLPLSEWKGATKQAISIIVALHLQVTSDSQS
jgi:hypothetical protein